MIVFLAKKNWRHLFEFGDTGLPPKRFENDGKNPKRNEYSLFFYFSEFKEILNFKYEMLEIIYIAECYWSNRMVATVSSHDYSNETGPWMKCFIAETFIILTKSIDLNF